VAVEVAANSPGSVVPIPMALLYNSVMAVAVVQNSLRSEIPMQVALLEFSVTLVVEVVLMRMVEVVTGSIEALGQVRIRVGLPNESSYCFNA
jgi:hypothetical protein